MSTSPERLARFFALAGYVVRPILRSPLHALLSHQVMVLTYTGGRSGRRYSFPIGYFSWDDHEVLAFSSRSWPKALPGAKNIHLIIRGISYPADVTVVSEHDRKMELLAEFAREKGPRTAKRLMLGLPRDRLPSSAELDSASDQTTIVRFRPRADVSP